jgi:hypothetical protein
MEMEQTMARLLAEIRTGQEKIMAEMKDDQTPTWKKWTPI